jgi:hypothetical protein
MIGVDMQMLPQDMHYSRRMGNKTRFLTQGAQDILGSQRKKE